MTALRLFSRSEWEGRLIKAGCKPYDAKGLAGLETGEWWLTEHNRLFVVPCDTNGALRPDDWQEVVIQLAKLKPLDLDT